MTYSNLTEPDFLAHYFQARQARSEALSRASYRAVVAIDGALRLASGAVRGGFAWAFARYRAWREVRRLQQALLKLDDRLLRDIGLTRADAIDPAWLLHAQPEFEPLPIIDIALQPAEVRRCNDNRDLRLAA
jgi:uncharacterized protein YjiS (DUF1127 family)